MVRTDIRLPDELHEELRERAHKAKISLNQLMVLLLYQATGLGIEPTDSAGQEASK